MDSSKTPSFYDRFYSEIEEIGWEHLVNSSSSTTSFRVKDNKGRPHVLEVHLDETYPKSPPSVSADVPYLFDIKWSKTSRLKDLVHQFQEHLEKLQELWSTLDEVDTSLCVVDPKQPSRSMNHRKLDIGNGSFLMLSLNTQDPRSLPECRFIGSDTKVNSLMRLWQRNSTRWIRSQTFLTNLESIFEIQLPRPLNTKKDEQQVECGICYAQHLPFEDGAGTMNGIETDCSCDNGNCNRAFHSVCLEDWLRSIITTRQSFNVLFGNCPYCSEPIAVKINDAKNHQ